MESTAAVRIVTARAPSILPSLLNETRRAANPLILVPGTYTLACEQELIRSRDEKGFIGLNIYSPQSLIREVRELTGGTSPLSGEAQIMLISQILHHHSSELKYYADAVGQPSLAKKIADQINEFSDAHLDASMLLHLTPESRRTQAKLHDLALIWDAYEARLQEGYTDLISS